MISFVIPLYNEEERIAKTVHEIKIFQKNFPGDYEWIFVDDGSTDETEQRARQELRGMEYRWLQLNSNQGKGKAVQKGMLEARGDFIFFTDTDLSTPLSEHQGFLQVLKDGYDLAIGSRGLADSRVLVHQNWLRETMGKIFNRIARLLTFKRVKDSQCGFKGFRKEAAHGLFQKQRVAGFSFDAEIIYLAQKMGYRIAELPVTWVNSKASKVHIVRDSIRMFLDLFQIRWYHRKIGKD